MIAYDKFIAEGVTVKKFICVLLILCTAAAAVAFCACGKKRTPVSEYDIFVIYDEKAQTVTGTVDFDFYNDAENELSDLKFNLYGNAFREGATYSPVSKTYETKAYYAGKCYGGMEITNVENCGGWDVAGEDENILIVNLIEPVYPEQRVQIKISYTLTLAKVNHRTGVTADTVNLGNFYPVLCAYFKDGFAECPYYSNGDPFVSACANYSVTIDLPAAYTAASSGKAVNESAANDRKKCSFLLENARDFALVLSEKFEVVSEEVDGVTVSYYYTADENAQVSLSAAADSVRYFSETFGKYAYPTLSVVQTGFCYGGMEYPGLTMIASGLDSDDNVYTIVHENAHQWWYAMVGSDQMNNAWQDEGLAEYSALMFFENHPTYGYTRTGMVMSATNAYRAFFSVYNQLNGKVDTSMTRNLKDYSSEFEYVNVTYNKGLILFETLRTSIGDEAFLQGLKAYFTQNCGKIASAEDLFGCFIKSGTDLEGFFDSFVSGKILI